MVLRADGHFFLTDVSGSAVIQAGRFLSTSTGAYLTTSGTWTNLSDENLKENFAPVDGGEVLEQISKLKISKWNYKKDGEAVEHIGPVAQDFYEKFGLGADNKSISTIDPSGIALAGIKALYEKSKHVEALELNNKELIIRLERLEKVIEELSAK